MRLSVTVHSVNELSKGLRGALEIENVRAKPWPCRNGLRDWGSRDDDIKRGAWSEDRLNAQASSFVDSGKGSGLSSTGVLEGIHKVQEGVALRVTREGLASKRKEEESVLDEESKTHLLAWVAMVCVRSINIC